MHNGISDEPRFNLSSTVTLAIPGDRNYSDHDERGEVIATDIAVENEELEVVSMDWERGQWVYNLRNDDGLRVWNVVEEDLDGDEA